MKTNLLSSLSFFLFASLSAQTAIPDTSSFIEYASPGQACQLNCTIEEFANAINPLICHAVTDFENETGVENEPSEKYRIFDVRDVSIPGVVDMFFTLQPEDKTDLIGKDLVLMFQCQDGLEKEDAQRYFDVLSEAIKTLKPDCTSLYEVGTYEDLGDDFLKASSWEGEIYTDDLEEYVDLELDLKIIDSAYWVILHINIPDDY